MSTITQTITALPSAPNPASDTPTTFSTKAAAFVLAQTTMATEQNTMAGQINTVAGEVNTNAATATIQANSAALSAAAAASSALVAGAAVWVTGTTYATGDVRYSPTDLQTYRRVTNGAGSTDPSSDATNWTKAIKPVTNVTRSVRTSNTIIGISDVGTLIDITSGTFTQMFSAAATLGNGWCCYIRNAGDGDVTLDPNASELIDGLTSYVMYPGECRLITCDGTSLGSVILNTFYKIFTTTSPFVKPPGYRSFGGLMWGPGNSGQRTNSLTTLSRGGGGGGCFPFELPASALAASETVTIGAGGLAVTTVANGNFGGSTSLGSLLTVWPGATNVNRGGAIGLTAAAYTAGATTPATGFGAARTTGETDVVNTLYGGSAASSYASSNSASSLYGGAAGGGVDASGTIRAPGTSIFGGDGGAANTATNGVDGTVPGGGGGATQTGTQSGAGARGELHIRGIA